MCCVQGVVWMPVLLCLSPGGPLCHTDGQDLIAARAPFRGSYGEEKSFV